ncbi:class I SAM-dependent methyltransferase [Kiloniella laminariae]|uniref:Class I SAM-dependent methyltransferase n=1 Tax=Kiloniella laminariae TaxID=454162 RepID=A0ABT4LDS0_9PROT|nr:class I SAM-dependent methyltransferase [Kiloniella laminariae]MCZ4279245.1 class I SAM-dependent methyltransferase [Kiloniella laminariae]
MAHSARFWDKIAVSYSKRPVADEAVYQQKLQKSREYFHPEMDVLEIGCGTGTTALSHASFVKHIRATDISSGMLTIARDKAKAQNINNVTFEQSDIDQLTVPDQSLDAVLALSLLHLVENKEEVISRVYKMLKPGGYFITSTVCLGDKMKYFKFIAPIGKFFGLMPLLKIFTAKEMENALTAAGFEIDHLWQPEKAMSVFIVARKK